MRAEDVRVYYCKEFDEVFREDAACHYEYIFKQERRCDFDDGKCRCDGKLYKLVEVDYE